MIISESGNLPVTTYISIHKALQIFQQFFPVSSNIYQIFRTISVSIIEVPILFFRLFCSSIHPLHIFVHLFPAAETFRLAPPALHHAGPSSRKQYRKPVSHRIYNPLFQLFRYPFTIRNNKNAEFLIPCPHFPIRSLTGFQNTDWHHLVVDLVFRQKHADLLKRLAGTHPFRFRRIKKGDLRNMRSAV